MHIYVLSGEEKTAVQLHMGQDSEEKAAMKYQTLSIELENL